MILVILRYLVLGPGYCLMVSQFLFSLFYVNFSLTVFLHPGRAETVRVRLVWYRTNLQHRVEKRWDKTIIGRDFVSVSVNGAQLEKEKHWTLLHVFSSPFTLFTFYTWKSFRLNSTLVSLFRYVASKNAIFSVKHPHQMHWIRQCSNSKQLELLFIKTNKVPQRNQTELRR